MERKRLFELPRLVLGRLRPRRQISDGGGVFDRTREVDPAVARRRARRSAIEDEALKPSELIHALLRAPVDLLWNGGIGTYVKAARRRTPTWATAPTTRVRVNATELRAKVVGEGGNLGFTQRGRVEFALAGGRINTDAIDNSGGVDCSDREVNIKILLGAVVEAGELTEKQRDELLWR